MYGRAIIFALMWLLPFIGLAVLWATYEATGITEVAWLAPLLIVGAVLLQRFRFGKKALEEWREAGAKRK